MGKIISTSTLLRALLSLPLSYTLRILVNLRSLLLPLILGLPNTISSHITALYPKVDTHNSSKPVEANCRAHIDNDIHPHQPEIPPPDYTNQRIPPCCVPNLTYLFP
jgi:hypothetical protein